MRVLVLSECSRPIEADALYDEMRCFLRGVVAAVPDAFFEVVLPAKDSTWGQYDTSDLEHPRIRLHFVPMLPSNTVECVMMTRDLYELVGQNKVRFFYDAILNCRTLFAPLVKKVTKSKYAKFSVDVPIFNHTGGVRADTAQRKALLSLHGEDEVIIEVFAGMMDFIQVHSPMERDLLMANWRKYLAPAFIQRNLERIYTYRFGGFDFRELDRRHEDRKPGKSPCLIYGGRMVSTKGWQTFLEFVGHLWSTGKKFKAIVSTPDKPGAEDTARMIKANPAVEFHFGVGRSEFYRLAALADLFVCDAREEPFGRSFVEMQYAGAWGLYRNREYVRNLVPPGYPDVFNDKSSMYARLTELVTRWNSGMMDEANDEVRAWIRGQYDYRDSNVPFWRWMEARTTEFYAAQGFGDDSTMVALARKVSATVAEVPTPIGELWHRMTSASASKRQFGAWGDIMNPFYLRRALIAAGLRDTCAHPEPSMIRGVS